MDGQHQITRTNTVPGEIHQIQAYVEAISARIGCLEDLVELFSTDQIADIKDGLKHAYNRLEHLETSFQPAAIVIADVAREVRAAHRRLQKLDRGFAKERREVMSRSIESRPVVEQTSRTPSQYGPGFHGEKFLMTGGLPGTFLYQHHGFDVARGADESPLEDGQETWYDASVGRQELGEMAMAARAYPGLDVKTIFLSPHEAKEEEEEEGHGFKEPRPRTEVMANLLDEEFEDSIKLRDPDRVRRGSTSGWLCAQEMMAGVKDARCVRPELAYVKIHELKSLKQWLVEHKYLVRSGGISRTEKLLHLMCVLQYGCRLEKVAVWFSRSPGEVERSCRQVVDGMLELYSETMLPRKRKLLLYPDLWKIAQKWYSTREKAQRADVYFPWTTGDIGRVVVTINFLIGRWRAQGCFRLDGPVLDWGSLVEPVKE